ncbi:glycosyltransferase family 1 protein [soil metagenome]
MATLRVIIDQIVAPVPGGIGRYAEELTRQLIVTAPRGARVAGIVSASPEADYATIQQRLPGLTELYKSPLARRELSAAWAHGFTRLPGTGLVHATSLLAPLHRHDRASQPGEQTVVTIHDAVPWTHPETLTPRGVSWHKRMAKRAERYADAIVVPTHAVADELSQLLQIDGRVRVIGGAVGSGLVVPTNAAARAAELKLPERYLMSVGTLEPRKGLEPLIRALARPESGDLPLLVVGPDGWGGVDLKAVAKEAHVDPNRIRAVGHVSDSDLALMLSRATAFVFPSLAEGFGLPVLEAMSFGVPVIHSDAPAVVEVAGEAGYVVPLADADGYPARLAEAIGAVVGDEKLAAGLSVSGRDRSGAFSWRDSAEKVWQLHSDL